MDAFIRKMSKFSNSDISVIARHDFDKLSVLHIKSESESAVSQLFSFSEVSSIEVNVFKKVANDEECQEAHLGGGLWGLGRIATREPSSHVYSYKATDGAGSYVYLFDSGIRFTHNEFGGRAFHGYIDPLIPENETDWRGHGTHCAGTIIGRFYGVARAATAISIKVLNAAGWALHSGTMEGLHWVYEDFAEKDSEAGGNFPAVISMSFGFRQPSDVMDEAFQELFDVGLPSVVAAGNMAFDACAASPLSRAEAAITVMSSDANNALADFSSYGAYTDIIAPGVDVLSAGINSDSDFRITSGTSMACPHVAGVVLRHVTQVLDATGRRTSPSEVREWLLENSTKDSINIRDRPSKLLGLHAARVETLGVQSSIPSG